MDWFRSQERSGSFSARVSSPQKEVHPFFDARFFRNTQPEEGYLNPFSTEPAHPPDWHFSPEFNGVPSGFVYKELKEETKALVPFVSSPARNPFSISRNISKRNIKLGLLGLGAIGLTGWMFSGRDDNYNNIEGLLHGGSAQQLRKQNTEFGSGWDPMRKAVSSQLGIFGKIGEKISSTLGRESKAFNKFIRTPEFQKSLSSAKYERTLGEGSFGIADLMSSKVNIGGKEHSFNFVRKSMYLSSEKEIIKEAKTYNKLGHLNAPSFYGLNENNQILMEHIQGEMAHDVMLKGGSLKPETIEDLASFMDKSHKMGIAHTDMTRDVALHHGAEFKRIGHSGEIVPHNVIITPEGRAAVIDFGEARAADNISIGLSSQHYLGRTDIANAKGLDNALIDGLRKQKGRISPKYQKDTQKLGLAQTELSPVLSNSVIISKSMSKRKLEMAATQRGVALDMFENGRSGGRRSKSSFVSSKSMVRTVR